MAKASADSSPDYIRRLIDLLGLSQDEVLAALLSAFVPSNPGSLAAAWAKRNNYAAPPSGDTFWKIMVAADFRCEKCHTHYDLTFHHRNDDANDSRLENLQLLCRNCNREHSGRPVKQRDLRIRIFKGYLDLHGRLGRPPTQTELRDHLQIDQLSGSTYMYHFLNTRFGAPTVVRHTRKAPQSSSPPAENI